jgi:hypothetical protein
MSLEVAAMGFSITDMVFHVADGPTLGWALLKKDQEYLLARQKGGLIYPLKGGTSCLLPPKARYRISGQLSRDLKNLSLLGAKPSYACFIQKCIAEVS